MTSFYVYIISYNGVEIMVMACSIDERNLEESFDIFLKYITPRNSPAHAVSLPEHFLDLSYSFHFFLD